MRRNARRGLQGPIVPQYEARKEPVFFHEGYLQPKTGICRACRNQHVREDEEGHFQGRSQPIMYQPFQQTSVFDIRNIIKKI